RTTSSRSGGINFSSPTVLTASSCGMGSRCVISRRLPLPHLHSPLGSPLLALWPRQMRLRLLTTTTPGRVRASFLATGCGSYRVLELGKSESLQTLTAPPYIWFRDGIRCRRLGTSLRSSCLSSRALLLLLAASGSSSITTGSGLLARSL